MSQQVATSSCYAVRDGRLVGLAPGREPPGPLAVLVHDAVRGLVLSRAFPCVAGASAVRRGAYLFGLYDRLGEAGSVGRLADGLRHFIAQFPAAGPRPATFVASFREPVTRCEPEFERLLWDTLQLLHDRDDDRVGWDPGVSADPADPLFSFSFAGRAFFVVGLHGAASRWSRRLTWPTLVFNAHAQFEALRHGGRMDAMQQAVRRRDRQLQGSLNPVLGDFGALSEARQYAGNPVDDDWTCPLRVRSSFQ